MGAHKLIGNSPQMRELHQFIVQAGPVDSTVLIEGETGTGKELVARAIHGLSLRSGEVFVAINCAELSEALVQSELFGHERGAFTGADGQKMGWFELATGGTLFLDEIGELTPALQSKFLRVLQERKIHRLGGTRLIDVDIRLIAATNVDLERAVEDELFRQDLYYRLNVLSVRTPPLRERRDDIAALIDHFRQTCGRRIGRKVLGISREAAAILAQYSWPG